MMKNKKGDLPTTLLVIMVVVLVGIALFSLNSKPTKVFEELPNPLFVNKLISDQQKIDYYILEIMKTAASNSLGSSDFEDSFITQFKKESEAYKRSDMALLSSTFDEIENQFVSSNVQYDGSNISLILNIRIKDKISVSESGTSEKVDLMWATYIYTKLYRFDTAELMANSGFSGSSGSSSGFIQPDTRFGPQRIPF